MDSDAHKRDSDAGDPARETGTSNQCAPSGTLVALALTLLAIGIYEHTLDAPLVFDDVANIKHNPHVQMNSWSWEQLSGAAFASRDNDRPLAYVSFAITHWAFAGDVAGQRIVNIAIHILTGLLVFALARLTLLQLQRLGQFGGGEATARWTALAAALLFVAHPIQTQAVTYVVQRMTSMATLLYLAALLLYVHGRLSQRPKTRWSLWAMSLLAWALALGSKQIAATLPAAVLLYEWYFFQDLSTAWLKRMLMRFALPAAAMTLAVAMFYLDGNPLARLERGYATRDFTVGERLLTQPRVVADYLGLIAYPAPERLSLLHGVETSRSLNDPASTSLALALLGSLLTLAIVAAKRHRLLSFCLLWFFLHLVIESTVLPLEMMYEHRLYLPMSSVSLLAAYGAYKLSRLRIASTGMLQPASVCLVIALLATLSHVRNDAWVDPVILWTQVLEQNQGEFPAAAFQRSRAYNNRGNIHGIAGNYDAAIADFTAALEINPADELALFNRGMTYATQSDDQAAIADFTRAIDARAAHGGTFAESLLQRGRAHRREGNYQAAVVDLHAAAEAAPGLADIFLSLAWIRATCPEEEFRDAEAAVAIATKGCERTHWQSPTWLDVLACAHAESGNFEEAVQCSSKAVELTRPALHRGYIERLRLFGQQQAFRDLSAEGA